MKNDFNEIGTFTKNVLKDKILIKLRSNIDFTRHNIIGKAIYNRNGQKIGKILDVLGNVKEPYALAMLDKDLEISETEKIFVNHSERRSRK
ncbi:H/ACA RNA-protein complex protein Gar1 [Saccharolobus solfataricus]|uniref:H/ACA RNA-protein complex protein Gar1 n=2 Tax=Saccharolobus solfataricus TaxID=2287 RepID=A0A0E3JUD0_SACSO|nr:Gar1/Naf1 family protein [Saccharolobus solfataricus]AKA74173.1 H/ACA RNA-protein complex protein Gar1 [Saccharolobus solfataricus]AKA76871.1 H/ACA RNA-protein complex protein Gar1 [Saccharolobus solfataricus]AKA79564.1 H/ACA RNA-protein complex protein Gar1 [Saccharolobus solfataricus]AZF68652.1 H/ACA RNA-protein complex protein Gar1 [Saccharolobus solfataricus]AZF71272.1 H/ACA RNA-protein complex protein Gar1 [Saccharolobus solfataricus]